MEFRCRFFVAPIIVGFVLAVLTSAFAYEASAFGGSSTGEPNRDAFENQDSRILSNEHVDVEADVNVQTYDRCHCPSNSAEKLVLVSTMDGQLTALNGDFFASVDTPENANFVWRFDPVMGPLLASTLDDMPIYSPEDARIIPSLDGTLYMYTNAYIEAMPVNTEALLSSSTRIGPDVIAGGKDLRTFGISRNTGQITYECGIDGCHYFNPDDHSDKIIVRRLTQTVRAVDGKLGIEKWNVTTGSFDISLSSTLDNRDSNCFCDTFFGKTAEESTSQNRATVHNDDLDLKISPAEGKILAFDKRWPGIPMWIYHFDVPIAQVWTLIGENLKELSLVDAQNVWNLGGVVDAQSNLKYHEADSLETVLYVGTYEHEKYIITSKEEKLMHIQSQHNPLVPRDRGRIYLADFSDQSKNGKPCSAEEVNAVILHNQFQKNTGWYFVKHKTPEASKRLEAWSVTKPHHPQHRTLLIGQDANFSIWDLWKQISVIVVLFALGTHLVVFGCLRWRHSNYFLAMNSIKKTESDNNANGTEATAARKILQAQTSSAESEISQTSNLSSEFESRYLQEFEPLRCLGKGGFGIVYEARNKLDDVNYAVKRIALANTETAKNRVMREVKALAKLDHPGIVRYYHSWLESPPIGWQESKDAEILLKCGFYDESNFTVPEVVGNSADLPMTHNEISDQTSSLAIEFNRKFFGGLARIESSASSFGAEKENKGKSKTNDLCSESCGFSGTSGYSEFSENYEISESPGINRKSKFMNEQSGISNSSAMSRNYKRSKLLDGFEKSNDSYDVIFENSKSEEISESEKSSANRKEKGNDEKISDCLEEITDAVATPIENENKCQSLSPRKAHIYLYIQMQLCSVSTLRHWMTANQQRDRTEMLDWFLQIAVAVEYFHSCGMIHRDLKPSNIFFSLSGQIKIGDFGLAKSRLAKCDCNENCNMQIELEDSTLKQLPFDDVSQHTDNVGTALYMSPEQVDGKPYTEKVDIYSLGLIFVEMLCPCATDMERLKTLTMAKQLCFSNCLSNDDAELTRRMLAQMPEDRASCSEICDSKIFDVIESPANPSAALRQRSRTKSRNFTPSISTPSINSIVVSSFSA